jgi:hypothetical protein
MVSTVAGIVVILVLVLWHLRTRRHPHWRLSRDARFYITTAYPFLVVAVFFLANATNDTDLNWISGIGWAFIATVMLVYGFQALDSPEDGAPSTAEPDTAPATKAVPSRTASRAAARRKSAGSKH